MMSVIITTATVTFLAIYNWISSHLMYLVRLLVPVCYFKPACLLPLVLSIHVIIISVNTGP